MLVAAIGGTSNLGALYEATGVIIAGTLGLIGVLIQARRNRHTTDEDDEVQALIRLVRQLALEEERADREERRADRERRRADACEAREQDRGDQ